MGADKTEDPRSAFTTIVRDYYTRLPEHAAEKTLAALADTTLLRQWNPKDRWVGHVGATAGNAAAAISRRLSSEPADLRNELTSIASACAGLLPDERLFRLGILVLRKLVLLAGQLDEWYMEQVRAENLLAMATVLAARYQRQPTLVLLSEAVTLGRDAASFAPRGHPYRPEAMAFLAGRMREIYEHNGDTEALAGAIEAAEEALALRPDQGEFAKLVEPNAPTTVKAARARCLGDLGQLLLHRYGFTGRPEDLRQAMDRLRAAVETEPTEPAHWVAFSDGHRRAGQFREAILDAERAVRLGMTPGTLHVLAAARHQHFASTGDPADLAAALALLRRAMTPGSGTTHAACRTELGSVLVSLFELHGDSRLLDEAVEHLQWAVRQSGDRDRAATTRLAEALLHRLRRAGDLASGAEAIAVLRTALADPPRDRRAPAVLRCLLARALHDHFVASSGRPAHLREAILLLDRIDGEFPVGHPERPEMMARLGNLPRDRARLVTIAADSGTPPSGAVPPNPTPPADAVATDALDPVIHDRRAWAEAAPAGGPEQAQRLVELGTAIRERFTRSGQAQDRTEAIRVLMGAALSVTAATTVRSVASREWAELAAAGQDWLAAIAAYRQALELLPQLAPAELRREDQEYRLTSFAHLARDAAACAVRAGCPGTETMDLLERGRGVLLAQAVQLRAEPAGPAAVAVDGPIVAVNVSAYGCHALIVDRGQVQKVPLPDLSTTEIDDRAEAFALAVDLLGDRRQEPEHRWAGAVFVERTLGWLWDTVAAPVLTALDERIRPASDGTLKRLWWMPTGALTYLPLHAAGYHTPGRTENVLDRVVPSYTPTIRALSRARAARHARGGWTTRPLVVAVSGDTLPHARAEVELVAGALTGARLLDGPDASRADVLAALSDATMVHFACHARSLVDEPSASHLALHDGPLSVHDIGDLALPDAGLAFLSACGTARGGEKLTDEAIHMSGAFQLAGYPHVIATLWSVGDDTAAAMAARVYSQLTDSTPDGPARAVHAAVRAMREQCAGRSAFQWAAYIHTGP